MNTPQTVTPCPVCSHHYYPEDKTSYRVCTKCAAEICTVCASQNLWTCSVCRNPHGILAEVE